MFPLVDLNTESAGSFAAVVNLFANQCDIFRRVPWWAFSALWCSSSSSPHAPAATSHLILTQQAHGQMCKEAGSHSASVLFHRMPLQPRSAKCVPAFCKLLLFITHTCGSGTNANSRFGLVLFCLLMKRLLLFLIQWSAWSGQQCLYEKVVMRCQSAQCNGRTGSTLSLNMSTSNDILKEMWLLLCYLLFAFLVFFFCFHCNDFSD